VRYFEEVIEILSPDVLGEARDLLAAACRYDRAAPVAEEKLFGPAPAPHQSVALGARVGGRLVGVAVVSGRWLRLIAVAPDQRRRGIGTTLLEEAEAHARGWGATRLRGGDQPGNYLSPGVDARNEEMLKFLRARGFAETARYENLLVPLLGNPRVTRERAVELAEAAAARGYEVRRAHVDDGAAAIAFAGATFAPVWAFELERALENDPPGVHLAVAAKDGAVVAFACHDGNNRGLGWFGPAGTAPAARGLGLGQALLLPCLLDIGAAGHDEAVIAWIGPRKFYQDAAGAVDDRSFVVLEKGLA
jgi:mycothiol synthase